MMQEEILNLTVEGSGKPVPVRPARLVVAGYTARDEASVRRHIEELAGIGVPPPPSVPMFYNLDPALLSTGARVEVTGPATSGEVEPVLVRHRGTYFLGVGSDHTDRDLERSSIAASKAACPKPVGRGVLEIGTDLSLPGWDGIEARSEVDGQPYQKGPVSSLRHPAELLDRMAVTIGDTGGDLVMFCGTLPLLRETFEHGDTWSLSLLSTAGPALRHTYTTHRSKS